jgi:hypothetical protein
MELPYICCGFTENANKARVCIGKGRPDLPFGNPQRRNFRAIKFSGVEAKRIITLRLNATYDGGNCLLDILRRGMPRL